MENDATPIQAVLTDIEGTTTSCSFVYDVLFPYAKGNVESYLQANASKQHIAKLVEEINAKAEAPTASLGETIAILKAWMDQDKKITPLKTLQGLMWEDGYNQGAFQGHVYEDAYLHLKRWKSRSLVLAIFSSGSVQAQQLLFAHSTYGNMTPFFSQYFDTTIGNKRETNSYSKIAQSLATPIERILFLSDTLEELNAAQMAGMQTTLVCRGDFVPDYCLHPIVTSFDEIEL